MPKGAFGLVRKKIDVRELAIAATSKEKSWLIGIFTTAAP